MLRLKILLDNNINSRGFLLEHYILVVFNSIGLECGAAVAEEESEKDRRGGKEQKILSDTRTTRAF